VGVCVGNMVTVCSKCLMTISGGIGRIIYGNATHKISVVHLHHSKVLVG